MAMPAATAPIGKPAGFTKPAGFAKPAGFGKPAAADDDDEPKKDHPVVLTLAILSVLVMGFVCFLQYQIDQTPGRLSEYVFGAPVAEDASYSEDEGTDDSSASEEPEDSEAEEESEEE